MDLDHIDYIYIFTHRNVFFINKTILPNKRFKKLFFEYSIIRLKERWRRMICLPPRSVFGVADTCGGFAEFIDWKIKRGKKHENVRNNISLFIKRLLVCIIGSGIFFSDLPRPLVACTRASAVLMNETRSRRSDKNYYCPLRGNAVRTVFLSRLFIGASKICAPTVFASYSPRS